MSREDLTQYLEIRIEKLSRIEKLRDFTYFIPSKYFTDCSLTNSTETDRPLRFWIKPQDIERMKCIGEKWFEQRIQPEEVPKALEDSLGYTPIIYGTNVEGIEAKIKEFLDAYQVLLSKLKDCCKSKKKSDLLDQIALAKEKVLATKIGKTAVFYDAWGKYWDKCFIKKVTLSFIDVSAVWPTENRISIIPSHTAEDTNEPKPGVLLGPGYHPGYYYYIKSDFIIRFRGIPLSLSPPKPSYLPFMGFNESEHGWIKFVMDEASGTFYPKPNEDHPISLDMDRHFLSGANLNYIQLGSGSINKFFAHLQEALNEFKH